jgi:hypothetical protein
MARKDYEEPTDELRLLVFFIVIAIILVVAAAVFVLHD